MAMLSLWLAAAPSVPRRIHDVKPIYPPESLKIGDEGAILFELSVDASGAVQDALMLWSGCKRLESAALAAVRQWRYEHVLVNSTPVPFKIVTSVPFQAADTPQVASGPIRRVQVEGAAEATSLNRTQGLDGP